jgi:protein involved in polysaccharide export with SLBB domain
MNFPAFFVLVLVLLIAPVCKAQTRSREARSSSANPSQGSKQSEFAIRKRITDESSFQARNPLNSNSEVSGSIITSDDTGVVHLDSIPVFGSTRVTRIPREASPLNNLRTRSGTASLNPTAIYLIGVGDVLDIRIHDSPSRNSTLFTVRADGSIDYPLAGDPLCAAGLTADEVKNFLESRVKVLDDPKIDVSIRAYGSHKVTVTGLVGSPGVKALMREAVPLYILLAETEIRPEATRATITRKENPTISIDLLDTKSTETLILPGDMIHFAAGPPKATEFFYVGGQINSPGQKDFHNGLTLTQAILASGGVAGDGDARVRISRQKPDGRLDSVVYRLKRIESGDDADPILQAGDRLEVRLLH